MDDISIPSKADMPVWLSDSEIDPSWIKEKMPSFQDVTKCKVKDISNDGRRGSKIKDGATLLLELTSSDDTKESKTLVAKQVPPSGLQLSRKLGLAREAMFYEKLAPKIKIPSSKDSSDSSSEQSDPCIPKIYYSSGDMNDGSKIVVMEDLSGGFVDSGILFGPGNPNNWKRNLTQKVADAFPTTVLTSFEVANQTFLAIATVHAAFWRDTTLLEEEWLRGSSWIRGQDENAWWASQGMIKSQWQIYLSSNTDEGIRWDPLVWEIVDKAVKGICWESYRKRLNENTNFCLVHGDFWPGNIMISKESTGTQGLRLLDWEMVGLGSGPQDLGQYIISNMDPSDRGECEEKLIRNYYKKLVELGVPKFTLMKEDKDDVWNVETVLHYLHRLVAIGTSPKCTVPAYQYFGIFASVALSRLECLLTDYTGCLLAMAPVLETTIQVTKHDQEAKAFTDVVQSVFAARLSLAYHAGISFLMLRRYKDAINTVGSLCSYMQRGFKTGQLRKLPNSDQLYKNYDRMIALLAICTHLCPQANNLVEENISKVIREKHGGQLNKEAYSDLFVFCAPKFVSPVVPNFEVASSTHTENAYKHQVQLLEQELGCQKGFRTLRSYLNLYTSIAVSKLVNFGNDELTLASLKLKLRQHESTGVPSLHEATQKSALDIHYYLEDDEVVHVDEAEKQRRFENYFLGQIVQSYDIRKDANAINATV